MKARSARIPSPAPAGEGQGEGKSLAMLRLVEHGARDVERGRVRSSREVFRQLRRRLAARQREHAMEQPARPLVSFDEYLCIERESGVRHEFLEGVAYAIGGGTDQHAAIAANVIRVLGNQLLGKPCRVYTSDLRVRVRATGLTTYPDASVICDRVTFDTSDPKRTTVLNPKVLVEVTSPSTAAYDRGEKLEHYKRIASVREIVIVSHDQKRIEVWRKSGSRWTRTEHRDVAPLQSINCTLSIADVYLDPFAD